MEVLDILNKAKEFWTIGLMIWILKTDDYERSNWFKPQLYLKIPIATLGCW